MNNSTIVIIDDDKDFEKRDESLLIELRERFEKCNVYNDPDEGIKFIAENLSKEIIVVLDLLFPDGKKDGHKILEEIRKYSKLIPVVIWSAADENRQHFSDLINNGTARYLPKTSSSKEIISCLVDVSIASEQNVARAIDEWITNQKDQDLEQPFITDATGRNYTVREFLEEVRQETDIGVKYTKGLIKLTVELLFHRKENIDD